MDNIYSILNGKPITPPDFQVGDSPTSEDGVKFHIMDSRWEKGNLEFLYCAHGIRTWASANAFRRA